MFFKTILQKVLNISYALLNSVMQTAIMKNKVYNDTIPEKFRMARVDIVVKGFRCERCSHEWIPPKTN